MIKPIILIPFFTIRVHPITVSKASDKKSPIIGIKLSTVNLAVFAITPSILADASPCIEIIPVKTVSMIPNKAIAVPRIREASLEIRTLSEILLIIDKIEENITIGITTVFIKVVITVNDV